MAQPLVILSRDAEQDLAELFERVATENGLDRAELILRRIESTLAGLAEWPRIGRLRSDLDGSPRVFAIWPWLVIYEPCEDGTGMVVWRVLDGRRDLPAIVGPPAR